MNKKKGSDKKRKYRNAGRMMNKKKGSDKNRKYRNAERMMNKRREVIRKCFSGRIFACISYKNQLFLTVFAVLDLRQTQSFLS